MDISGATEGGRRPPAALFGGAFNPLHNGHIALAGEIERRLSLSEVIFLPTGQPPHKESPEVSCAERSHMVDLAIAGRPGWRTLDIECRLPGPSLTARTLESLSIAPPPFFVMGEDAFADFLEWGGPGIILARSHLVIVNRPGSASPGARRTLLSVLRDAGSSLGEVDIPDLRELRGKGVTEWVAALPAFKTTIRLLTIDTLEVSSTGLRAAIASGETARWAHLLPEAVKSYIVEKGLYRKPDSRSALPS
ncbi:MAG: nicotinate (nicotinamide) nucleotide adenylyltransferase [Leptospirillia bacterium]